MEKKRRSQNWFGKKGKDGFIYRAWMKNQGYPADEFEGKPVIGICNTWSELTPCNGHFRELAEHVKRGVWEAGGFPLEFPVMSLGETLMKPTTMLYRNLASMDAEESIRGNPLDGIVLMGGCDKTTPSILMGASVSDILKWVKSLGERRSSAIISCSSHEKQSMTTKRIVNERCRSLIIFIRVSDSMSSYAFL